ncbi:hypothetical protein KR044_002795, partial [Drosophila immigrans]
EYNFIVCDECYNIFLVEQVTIEDCLGCESEHIKLPAENKVHLLLYGADSPMRSVSSPSLGITPVVQALKLMCTKEYATAASLQHLPQLHVGKGCVKMSFSLTHVGATDNVDDDSDLDFGPSTSRQAFEREELRRELKNQKNSSRSLTQYQVSVVRRFDDVRIIDRIMIQINSGKWTEQSVIEFCDIFFIQPQHIPTMLLEASKTNPANWMKVIQGDEHCYRNFRENGNPFETFAKLFHHQDYEKNELLEQLVSRCLFNREAIQLCERRFVLTVFDDVRQIFEYITNHEYTVWFFIPRLNLFPFHSKNVDDFDLSNVRTSIKLVNDIRPVFWHQADHNIMDILHVSFQLAFAKVGNQTVVFLSQLEKLAEFTSLQYARAFFMNNMYSKDENSPKWICQRYLQSIINVSEKLQLTVFIEYPRGLTLLREPRHVIKCVQDYDQNTDSVSWNLMEGVTKKAESNLHLIENII